ncbi:T9SS type B sorting domain-containing protein, partial [Flavobacterium sp. ZT3R18]|uniref:T9SS type B sorting domain-containing protein n=1 Tax=Flavobacterium sp. ZT3R18 TaxID=2594429 RepID=UPI001179F5B2
DPSPVVAAVLNTQCGITEGNFVIDVTVPTAGIAPYSFSIDGSDFQTQTVPFTISNLSSGTHTIQIKDKNGCGNPVVSVPILVPLALRPTVTTTPSCAGNNGVITVLANGGSANYTYNIDGGFFVGGAVFSGVTTGAHTMGVHDVTTGCEFFTPITLTPATPITGFTLGTTPVTCNGGTDGTITATMTTPAAGVNDNPVYKYTLSGITVTGTAINVGPQDSPLFSGLAAGNYTVDVVSGRGCPASLPKTVTQPNPIVVPAPTVTQYSCTAGNSGNLATISIDPLAISGGTAPYLNYEFIRNGTRVYFGPNNSYTEADLLGGNYVVKVYDSKGCLPGTSVSVPIAKYIALDKINVVINKAITCANAEDITVNVSAIGGIPNNLSIKVEDVLYDPNTGLPLLIHTYSVTKIVAVPTAAFTGLPVGSYLITVKNLDTNCEIQNVHYVNEPNTFDLTIDNIVNITCSNLTDGSAKVTFIDRVITATDLDQAGPFDYTLVDALGTVYPGGSSATATLPLTTLAAGTYTITATLKNTPFCSVSKSFTITGPTAALKASELHTEITCISGGSISASATGGWPGGYEYKLAGSVNAAYSVYSANSVFTNLIAGPYTLFVRDSSGCPDSISLTLKNPVLINFTVTPSTLSLSCHGDTNASITVGIPSGGQGSNYSYTLNRTSLTPVISSAPQAGNIFTDLGAGTYTITVTDGWGCGTTSTPIVITEPNVIVASLVKASSQTCKTESTLTLSVSGGTAPYSYSDTPSFAASTVMIGSSVTFPVPVGTYRYYIRDAKGCRSVVSNDIANDPLPVLSVAVNTVNSKINCKGDSTGVIIATATGGLGNYAYTLLNGAGLPLAFIPTQTTPGNFTQLPVGSYIVHVNCKDCQEYSVKVDINEPPAKLDFTSSKTDVKCAGNGDGSITVNGFDGTGIIKYAITPRSDKFLDSGVFNNLKPGTYMVIVQDENGCYVSPIPSFIITEPLQINAKVDPLSIKQEYCAGDKTGEFSISITGGIAPYSTSLDDPKGTYVLGQVGFKGLTGGNHTVYVKDANLCDFELVVVLDASVVLDPKANLSYDCVNNAPGNSVEVTIDASNKLADVVYSLDSSPTTQPSNVFVNLVPGDHFIMAHHKNGCVDATSVFNVKQVDPLTISIDLGGLNEIVATAKGGSGVYRYTVNGEDIGANNKYIYYKSGDYTVTVTDSNGCVAAVTKYFEFIDIIIPPIFTPTGDGTNDHWKPINTENYPDIQFVVYDRYGRIVGTFGAGQFWDGKYNGTELPMGDYWYVLKLRNTKDDREFVGHFTLYR